MAHRRSLGFARDDKKERVVARKGRLLNRGILKERLLNRDILKERLLNRGILKSNLDNSY
jgi:hypothetical protein